MKKNTAISVISILAVVAIVFCALYFSGKAKSGQTIKELSTTVSENTEQIEKMTEEIEEKDGQIETVTARAAEKEQQVEALTKELEERTAETERLAEETAENAEVIAELQAGTVAMTTEIEGLREDVAAKAGEIEGLKEDVAAKAGEIDNIKSDLNAKEEEISELKADMESKQEELDILTGKVEEYEKNAGAQEPVPTGVEGKYDATKFLRKALDDNGVKYRYYVDSDGYDRITSVWDLDLLELTVDIFIEDENHISFRVWDMIQYSDDNILNVMVRCNAINRDYKYASFYMESEDNSVTVSEDMILSDPSDAQVSGYRVFRVLIDILDDAEDILAPYAA